jgi:aconitase A
MGRYLKYTGREAIADAAAGRPGPTRGGRDTGRSSTVIEIDLVDLEPLINGPTPPTAPRSRAWATRPEQGWPLEISRR